MTDRTTSITSAAPKIARPQLDARKMSADQFARLLQQRGIQPDTSIALPADPGTRDPAGRARAELEQERLLAVEARDRARAATAAAIAKGAALEAGRMEDSRAAPASELRARALQLGLSPVGLNFAEPTKAQPVASPRAHDPESPASRIETAARALLSLDRVDVRTLDPQVARRYINLRWGGGGGW